MMRSTSRAPHKDEITNNTSFFSLPGLLVGFVKLMAEPDWARSPTSPLDCRLFSAFSSHFAQSPRSPGTSDAPRKSWDCDRVGLRLVYSLSDGATSCGRVLLGSPENRSKLLSSQTQVTIPSAKTRLDRLLAKGSATSPKSLPKNYMISSHTRIESPCFDAGGCAASLSASDIEQSEDYTCIISRGANPRTTRMLGDCVLGSCSGDVSRFGGNQQGMDGKGCLWMIECSEDPSPVGFPGEDFLRVCFSCKKKLDGKDIYMYRGEKAFCSCSCRSQEILIEEEMEEPALASSCSVGRTCCEEKILPSVAVAT